MITLNNKKGDSKTIIVIVIFAVLLIILIFTMGGFLFTVGIGSTPASCRWAGTSYDKIKCDPFEEEGTSIKGGDEVTINLADQKTLWVPVPGCDMTERTYMDKVLTENPRYKIQEGRYCGLNTYTDQPPSDYRGSYNYYGGIVWNDDCVKSAVSSYCMSYGRIFCESIPCSYTSGYDGVCQCYLQNYGGWYVSKESTVLLHQGNVARTTTEIKEGATLNYGTAVGLTQVVKFSGSSVDVTLPSGLPYDQYTVQVNLWLSPNPLDRMYVNGEVVEEEKGEEVGSEEGEGTEEETPTPEEVEEVEESCIQIVTTAEMEDVCLYFATPCDVPEGWTVVDECFTEEAAEEVEEIIKIPFVINDEEKGFIKLPEQPQEEPGFFESIANAISEFINKIVGWIS